MKYGRKIILSIVWVIVGIALVVLAGIGVVDPSVWSGFGGALAAVGTIQIIKYMKYKKDSEYREQYNTEMSDERNKFIRMKAWSWAGYLFVLIAGAATIVLMILGQHEIMMVTSYSVCLILVLYWLSYLVLRKKY